MKLSNKIYEHLIHNPKGRLHILEQDTGRIGCKMVLLLPTFNLPKKRLEYIIVEENKALLNSIENAEDNISQATKAVSKISINSQDVVIGLAASGNTPLLAKF